MSFITEAVKYKTFLKNILGVGGPGAIADGAVTNAKLANAPANTIKTNPSSATGAVQDFAVASSGLVGRTDASDLTNIVPHSSFTFDGNILTPSVYWTGSVFKDANDVTITLPSGLTYTDINNAGYTRWDSTNQVIIDGNGNPISGIQSVVNYNTLLSMSPATYANYAFIIENGMNKAAMFSDGSSWLPLNGQYVHIKETVPGPSIILPNSGITWVASNNGGKTRITASAAHGLSELTTEGSYLQVLNGTNWVVGSNHQVTPGTGYVSTTVLDLETPWNAGFGAPVFAVKGSVDAISAVTLAEIVLPALRSKTAVELVFGITLASNATVASRRFKVLFDGFEITSHNTTANNTYFPYSSGFSNKNATNAQRGRHGLNSNGYNISSSPPVDLTVDTSAAGKVLKIVAVVDLADTNIQLGWYELYIRG